MVLPCYNAATPSGYTRVTTVNDKVPMIVSAGSPGTVNASTWAPNDLAADPVSLTIAQMPAHDHSYTAPLVSVANAPNGAAVFVPGASGNTTGSTGGGATHAHLVSSAGTYRPPAAYMMLVVKN
jgi:hypothetical protein